MSPTMPGSTANRLSLLKDFISNTNKIYGGSLACDPCDDSEQEPLRHCEAADTADGYQNLRERILARMSGQDKFFSLEFFPPKTKGGAVNLLARVERLQEGGPLFCDVTWHPAGNPSDDTETSSLTIADATLNYCGLETMLHVTCCATTRAEMRRTLRRARAIGLRSVLALRGDPPDGATGWCPPVDGFRYAVDLVRFIREEFGDYFVVAVAGYPTGHPEAVSYQDDVARLKEKVDAGADFIITQLFFEAATFIDFVRDCRAAGIVCPIIPGVMPLQSYASLRHMERLSGLTVPEAVVAVVAPLRDNDEAVRNFGVHFATALITEVLAARHPDGGGDLTPGVHIYTLNREVAAEAVLRATGLWRPTPQRALPWKPAANYRRSYEDVRPIFWASRPKAYVYRTQHWDDFPNGRWGNSESPAFGELKDYYLFYLKSKSSREELLSMWGRQLRREEDVWRVFHAYFTAKPAWPHPDNHDNHGATVVTKVPWNDEELSLETEQLRARLAACNLRGVLTINSQPNVNGARSSDPVVGWGLPGGYVYQKAYLEFFTSPANTRALKIVLPLFPSVNYHIVNRAGSEDVSNCPRARPLAVTWGVFPGTEVIQPTVVDPAAFMAWKDEAFGLWEAQWGKLYDEGSESRRLISYIANNYCLVNLVDNDYPQQSCLWTLLEAMLRFKETTQGEEEEDVGFVEASMEGGEEGGANEARRDDKLCFNEHGSEGRQDSAASGNSKKIDDDGAASNEAGTKDSVG